MQLNLNFISKAFRVTLCTLFFQSVCVNGRIGRVRDVDGLAPELNRDHPHRQRSADSFQLSVCFVKSISTAEMSDFKEFFDEFVIKRLPGFDIVHIELPNSLAEEVILDIRSKFYVEAVEHPVLIHEHVNEQDIYWNLARITTRAPIATQQQLFEGSGYGNNEIFSKRLYSIYCR
eukprot:Awhi_evm1s14404